MEKILLIGNNGLGFYNFKKELVEELLLLNYEVHLFVPYYKKLDELVKRGAIYHVLKIDRRGINPFKDIQLIMIFLKVINEINPSLIISHTIKPNIYASIIARTKRINYINNITGLGSALQNDSIMSKILRFLYRISLKSSKGIFFENKENCDYFHKYKIGNFKKYVVVKGAGVNTDFYKSYHKIAKENIVFLCIARIMKDKGIEEYLQAAINVKQKYREIVKFQLLGGYDEQALFNQVNSLVDDKIIEYLGFSNDTRVEMSNADCLILPSYHEGMSNALLEGASFSLPLITTNIYGCKEAVEDGTTGFLCEPRDIISLISAMERFIQLSPKERIRMGELGRQKMIKEFERKNVVGDYISCIERILADEIMDKKSN